MLFCFPLCHSEAIADAGRSLCPAEARNMLLRSVRRLWPAKTDSSALEKTVERLSEPQPPPGGGSTRCVLLRCLRPEDEAPVAGEKIFAASGSVAGKPLARWPSFSGLTLELLKYKPDVESGATAFTFPTVCFAARPFTKNPLTDNKKCGCRGIRTFCCRLTDFS